MSNCTYCEYLNSN